MMTQPKVLFRRETDVVEMPGGPTPAETRNQQAATALIYAAWDAARTKLLLDKGVQVNVAAKDGTTPLMIAASAMGNTASVRFLLEHGADAKATDMFGDDTLIRAVGMSDSQVIELLLAKGAIRITPTEPVLRRCKWRRLSPTALVPICF